MSKPRRADLWSKHTAIPMPASAGSPFGDSHGMAPRVSCIRCGTHQPPAALGQDTMFRGQRRCIDRETCATARGGKS